MSSPLSRRLALLLPRAVLLLACCALVPSCGGVSSPSRLGVSGSLAKLHIDGSGRGGHLALQLRGPGGPPLDVTVQTQPGDSAQVVADRLVEAMRKSAWPEGATWKPWVVGIRITHVDEVLFRSTDVGLDIHLNMGTLTPGRFGVSVRGQEAATKHGNLIISGSGKTGSVPLTQNLFAAGYSSGQLLDQLEQSLTAGGCEVERRDDSLVCSDNASGGALTYMSINLVRGRKSADSEHAADWTWGLTLQRP